jgi:hypothetical protein
MIVINLNADSQLFLTQSETIQLAFNLESQLFTAANQIVIADIPLTIYEGWRLLENIEHMVEPIDWKEEGF